MGKASKPWPAHDNACTHCREKKIRCGRERPRCENCERDGAECGYSTPERRVNHVKLLCDKVGGLEDRLHNIEAELSFMNTLLKPNEGQKLSIETRAENESSGGLPIYDSLRQDISCLPPTDRHVIRNWSNHTDRYHGPCTLFALCNEFCNALLSVGTMRAPGSAEDEPKRGTRHNRPAIDDAAKNLLEKLCLEAGVEEFVDLQADPTPIQLPPKQFLLVAQEKFFQQADYATDLFAHSCFRSNVKRVYSRPLTTADEAWAICFNAIVLIILGPESLNQNSDPQIAAQFFRPYLLTILSAVSNSRVLMVAKIVNVQALALLSIAAQMYYPLGFAEAIFAQACVLARTMGLHQVHSVSESVGVEEAQERFKVFRSLFLRDKSSSISRGSICWLPSFDCSLFSEFSEIGPVRSKSTAWIQLAGLEDDIYQLLHSQRRTSAQYKGALLHLEQDLTHWASANGVFDSPHAGTREIDLQLEFLAARICIQRKSPDPGHVRQALSDSRASCLLVVISFGKHEPFMVEQLDTLLLPKSPLEKHGRGTPGRTSKSGKAYYPESTTFETSDYVPSRFHNLLNRFSVPAFFLLAMNTVWPSSAYDESKAEEDLSLLKRTCACFKELDAGMQANNHTRKVGRAFESLLEVIDLIKTSQQRQSAHFGVQQSTKPHNRPSTSIPFSEQYELSDFRNLPSPSASLVPPVSWGSFSNMNASATTPNSLSAGVSPGLLTPIDSFYQPYNPLQPNLFPPQIMRLPSLPRPHMSEPDVPMDDHADSMLVSDFLPKNPSILFNVTP